MKRYNIQEVRKFEVGKIAFMSYKTAKAGLIYEGNIKILKNNRTSFIVEFLKYGLGTTVTFKWVRSGHTYELMDIHEQFIYSEFFNPTPTTRYEMINS